jgi:hypothetical protein
MKKKILIAAILLLVLFCLGGYLFRERLMEKAGRFLAPQSESSADMAILEGTEYIPAAFIKTGMELLAKGRTKKIIVVLHRMPPIGQAFGFDGDYSEVIRHKLREGGLKEEQCKIIMTPSRSPITLNEAQVVVKAIAENKMHSAILFASSFHTRRSYLAYQYVAKPYNIVIYPSALFTEFEQKRWWTDDAGWREFASESGKLFYYLIRGHIPLRLSY